MFINQNWGECMNFILLSGGSGKRLWPLSNDIRSKQFLKLFKNTDDKYESMVQRVYRQIKSVNKESNVTIATSKTQVSAIRNQLGESVSICIEPCRRDTFPAIILAASYLFDVKKINENDCIIICPVDPYVDISYFEAIKRLETVVNDNQSDLVLMGIEPNIPSVKYGYIIPDNFNEISNVKAFREKPDKETAREFISQGALWNSGVFAFKLKYILKKAHELVEYTDYYDLYSKYSTLEKISIDYAVVEKEKSIQVVRYNGEWKDVGTWNMMAEAMSDTSIGNVIIDETSVNTQVVNELDIPILCMGCKDMVVAASCDGILVSDKVRSGAMKPYVEQINNEVHFAEKSWGTYKVIDAQEGAMLIKISVRAHNSMTYHSHELRREAWTVIQGRGCVFIDDNERNVSAGDIVSIPPGCKHTVRAETDMVIIESQIGSELSENDKVIYDIKK